MALSTSQRLLGVAFALLLLSAFGAALSFPGAPRASSARSGRAAPPKYTVSWFDTALDHFDYGAQPKQTFKLRILQNLEHWGKGSAAQSEAAQKDSCPGPIFFYTGNESPVTDYWNNSGFLTNVLAPKYGAAIIFAEHRYFGESLPFGNSSFSAPNIHYLSSDQALADYATYLDTFMRSMQPQAQNCPVIAFGGSYGGMLTAWFRMKYPNIVYGGLAASAPFGFLGTEIVNQNPYAFMDAAEATYAEAYPGCDSVMNKALLNLVELAKSTSGRAQMSSAFPTCKPLETENDALNIVEWLQGGLIDMVMLDYPYAADYGIQFPAWPVNATCKQLVETSQKSSLLQSISLAIQNYYNASGTRHCVDPNVDQPDFGTGSGWPYIACTDAYLPMAQRGMWWPHTTINVAQDEAACRQQFNVQLRPNWPRIHFGGFKTFDSASNLIFSNGLLDPWHALGVLKAPNPNVDVVVIPAAAHHLDLRGPESGDPSYVVAARAKEDSIIGGWIQKYWSERQ